VADPRSDGVVKKEEFLWKLWKKTRLLFIIANTESKSNNTEEVFSGSPSYFSKS